MWSNAQRVFGFSAGGNNNSFLSRCWSNQLQPHTVTHKDRKFVLEIIVVTFAPYNISHPAVFCSRNLSASHFAYFGHHSYEVPNQLSETVCTYSSIMFEGAVEQCKSVSIPFRSRRNQLQNWTNSSTVSPLFKIVKAPGFSL